VTSLGILGVSLRITIRAFACCQDEVCRCLWWSAAAAASSVFGIVGGDFAEVAVEVSVAGSQLCDG